MHLSTLLSLPLLALPLTHAYVITAFTNVHCTGTGTSANVWDNTCATWMPAFVSFRVEAFGASGQNASFYSGSSCTSASPVVQMPIDGTSQGSLVVGQCWNFGSTIAAAQSS